MINNKKNVYKIECHKYGYYLKLNSYNIKVMPIDVIVGYVINDVV